MTTREVNVTINIRATINSQITFLFWVLIPIFSCSRSDQPINSGNEVEQSFLAGKLDQESLDVANLKNRGAYMDIQRVMNAERGLPDTNEAEIEKVTRKFGSTKIDMSKLPLQSPVLDSGVRPWSSWWYPNFETTLFRGTRNDSPMQKYDQLRDYLYLYRRQPQPQRATAIAEEKYNSQAIKWEGLCNAWAFASIFASEPKLPRTFYLNSSVPLIFSPTDLKAILLKTFEAIPDSLLEVYGQKFTGEYNGWLHPDPYPDQFHRFVEKILGEEHRTFVMDHDPGVEIWNVPVFKANYNISAVKDRDDAVKVRLWLYTASPLNKNEINQLGTKETIREYQYILFGKRNGNELEVNSGIWILGENGTDSRRSHPDYMIDLPDPKKLKRESFNRAIEPELVDAIIKGDTIQ